MGIDISLEQRVEKDLKKAPKHVKERCIKIFEKLKLNPLLGIPLSGELKGERKIRIGDYRIIYKFFEREKLISIYRVEPRQSVYRN